MFIGPFREEKKTTSKAVKVRYNNNNKKIIMTIENNYQNKNVQKQSCPKTLIVCLNIIQKGLHINNNLYFLHQRTKLGPKTTMFIQSLQRLKLQ